MIVSPKAQADKPIEYPKKRNSRIVYIKSDKLPSTTFRNEPADSCVTACRGY